MGHKLTFIAGQMKYALNLYRIFAIALLVVSANAQTGTTTIRHYAKAALTFDYPEGWNIFEDNLSSVLTVVLTHPGSAAQIKVTVGDGAEQTDTRPMRRGVTKRTDLDPCGFEAHRKII